MTPCSASLWHRLMLTTASSPTASEEAANVIDATNRQLDDILAWISRWQVKFAAEKTQVILISHSREDARLFAGQLRFSEDNLAIHDYQHPKGRG